MRELFGIREMEKIPLSGKHTEILFGNTVRCGISAEFRNHLHSYVSEPAAWYPDGTPAMLKHRCGKGTAYYLSVPLEASLANEAFAFENSEAWKIYAELKKTADLTPPVDCPDPQCERFWCQDQPGHGWLTIINHRRKSVEKSLESSIPIRSLKPAAGKMEVTDRMIRIEALEAGILEIDFEIS